LFSEVANHGPVPELDWNCATRKEYNPVQLQDGQFVGVGGPFVLLAGLGVAASRSIAAFGSSVAIGVRKEGMGFFQIRVFSGKRHGKITRAPFVGTIVSLEVVFGSSIQRRW
jgi:hypothetical protein